MRKNKNYGKARASPRVLSTTVVSMASWDRDMIWMAAVLNGVFVCVCCLNVPGTFRFTTSLRRTVERKVPSLNGRADGTS